ncbi:MAG: proteasome-activating nucleotidase [Candidatus Hodarchaeaceae archaeon]|nr:proteasome-activating nucleotidase [Candidatus Hodarchaeaceae archaeon]
MSDAAKPKEQPFDETYIADYIHSLEHRVRDLEQEKRVLEGQYIKLDRELASLRAELNRIRTPPLIAATLLDVLEDGRAIVRSSAGPRFVVTVSQFIKPEELKPGAMVSLNQSTLSIVEVLPSKKDPLVLGMEIEEAPDVSYSDVGGLEDQIEEIRETVELPLLKPDLFKKVGIEPPKGVLLYGASGTGKTLLARAVAHETKATFIRAIGSELVQKYIGEGARLVREMFELAREKAPSIVFIDELDAIGARRMDTSTSGDREVHRTLMQLLAEIDGFDPRGDVRILAATNRPDILDTALLRPGRFDRLIYFPLPDQKARLMIFKIHTRKMNLSKDVDLKVLARATEKATGADIKAICTEAGMFAIRDGREQVEQVDFDRAVAKVLPPSRMPEVPEYLPKPEKMYGY